MKMKGRVALITGAGAGIGEATALLFAREGAKVCCNSLSESAKKVAQRIKDQGGEAIFVQGDISKIEDARKMVDGTVKQYGKLDILFNNAGIVIYGTVETVSPEDWDRMMAVNVRGIYFVSRFAVPELKKTKGTIIHNASAAALKGVKDRAGYSASKGAVVSMTRAMAADYMEDGIRVNCICPGTTETESLAQRISQSADPVETRRKLVARKPMGRLATVEEMAEGVLYLALAEFCTGVILPVDGGMTM
jgi:meso-butanediol dehydrogenase / (S,S)-butanediol dehydrogenase / diacetyl reductase